VTVSMVCGVMDRQEHLRLALPTWLDCPQVDEVVVVDWSSAEPVVYDHPRVVVARALGRNRWEASRCHNLGLGLAQGELVLRLDADDLLVGDFFGRHPLGAGCRAFYRANLDEVRDDNESHLAGVLYARRSDVLRAGGYNERIEVYGYEDTDLQVRLEAAGLEPRDLDLDCLRHLPHGDDARFGHQPAELFEALHAEVLPRAPWSYRLLDPGRRAVMANKILSESRPWSADDPKTRWKIEHRYPGLIHCTEED